MHLRVVNEFENSAASSLVMLVLPTRSHAFHPYNQRKSKGWKKGQLVLESLKTCSWFDGDIGQLQTLLFKACEVLYTADHIILNKHSAAATGT